MSNGISLQAMRQQLNIPATTSDADVKLIAQKLGVEIIDFSANGKSTQTQQIQQDPNTPLFNFAAKDGDMMMGLGIEKTTTQPQQQEIRLTQKQIEQGRLLLQQQTQAGETTLSRGTLLTQQVHVGSQASVSGQNPTRQKGKGITFEDIKQNPNVGRLEVVNGQLQAYDKSGNIMTGEDGKPIVINAHLKPGVASIEFKDGKVIRYDDKGNVLKSRDAMRGEQGYKKSGESFDERLARFYFGNKPDAVEKFRALSEEEQLQKAKDYVAWVKDPKNGKGHGTKVAIADFKKLVKNTGMSEENARQLGVAVFALSDDQITQAISEVLDDALTVEDAENFTSGVMQGIDLAGNSETQISVTKAIAESAKEIGISDKVSDQIGEAITQGKFENKEAYMQAAMQQYGLSPQQANTFYENLPEDVRQSMPDEAIAGVTSAQTHVAAGDMEGVPEEDRQRAADLSAQYVTYIDDADYQMQVITDNNDYINNNADDSMKEYYSNSVAQFINDYKGENREEIINMLKEQGYEQTMTTLEEKQKEYEAKMQEQETLKAVKQAENEAKASGASKDNDKDKTQNNKSQKNQQVKQTNTSGNTNNSNVNFQFVDRGPAYVSSAIKHGLPTGLISVGQVVISKEFKAYSMAEKNEYIDSLTQNERKLAIGALVESSDPSSLRPMLFSGLKNDVLKYLVNHSDAQNSQKLQYLSGFLSPTDMKFVEQLEEQKQVIKGAKQTDNK